ncbi:BZ3500_MvSof-1268-A1-R1_Chr3-3g06534 [Microbotryum saponariae]|uniref:BZ3500_MvSof-1268-A1-R1_Chr3-3g06534 protein n=1 Tax=Microbotryum saponariae TaxID=289078 RepID=A0A2X0L142_9BASI|nr:BZ3500_MvSof-1268-A1-R1_Chr3-3g06534 [Microbotryum saponariae]SDA04501.1 BZ3501_MvSof-1269-A2-R1_Chr3-2g06221 [Microbotryum saponariae]
MASPAPPDKLPAFDNSIGAFLIGTFLAVFLVGSARWIDTTQCFTYHLRFHRTDRLVYKVVVYGLFVLDTVHSAFCCMTIYWWAVTHYTNPAVLSVSPWTFTVDPAVTAIATIICQAFFAYRVYVISGRKIFVPVLIMTLSVLQFGFGVASSFMIHFLDSKFSRFHEFTYGVATWLVSAACADILITISLVYYLHRASSTIEYSKMHTVVERIIRRTIETNALTMLVAVTDAILFSTCPGLAWHVIPNFLLVKLYFNSLLVSLVNRPSLTTPNGSEQFLGHGTDGEVGVGDTRWSGYTTSLKGGSPIISTGGSSFATAVHHRPQITVQTQSVIECEKAHPYTHGANAVSGGAMLESSVEETEVSPRSSPQPTTM